METLEFLRKYNIKRWTLAFEGLGFMESIKQGEVTVEAATLQIAKTKAKQILTIYQNIFSVGDKIKFSVIKKESI